MTMWHQWYLFLRNKVILIPLIISGVINVISWILLFSQYQPGSEQIILHYNYYFGVDMIGTWAESLLMPTLGLFLILFNFVLAQWQYKRNKMISYFFVYVTPLLSALLFLAIFFIVLVNNPASI